MKTKLIKVSEDHYVIVDDSRKSLLSKGGSGYYLGHNHKIYSISDISNKPVIGQITHSTQPLEYKFSSFVYKGYDNIPLSEVEEAIYGYSVKKMAQSAFTHPDFGKYKIGSVAYYNGYKDGFKAHQELTKDKLFTVKQMKKALSVVYKDWYQDIGHSENTEDEYYNRIIQSLFPKTEWDIEIVDGKIKLL